MHTKSLCTLGLLILAAGTLPGQTYWSTSPSLDCGGSNAGGAIVQGPLQITAPTGGTGYVCYVSGTFLWYAAGAGWHTAIRVAAPESGAIRADYSFVGIAGNPLSLDLATNGGTTETQSGSEAVFTLNANQPLEVDLLGRTGAGPGYSNQTGGSVYAIFECPDATTCSYVTPQLLFSALPSDPWSLSVPICWDGLDQDPWSAVGLNDATHLMSFAIYNADSSPGTYTITVYDSNGNVVGTGTGPSSPLASLKNGAYGTGGVWAQVLSSAVSTTLPQGMLKVVISASTLSDVMVLQFDGPSATTLQVGQDAAPGASSGSSSVGHPKTRRAPTAFTPAPAH